MSNITEARKQFERMKGQFMQLQISVEKQEKEIKELKRDLQRHEEARIIIQEVGQRTQEQLTFHLSDITSLALAAVFPDPYELQVNFVQRRNKSECDLLFKRNENELDPMDASGGGAIDVTAFALRVASWSMKTPHNNNVIILDEPLKWVSAEYQEAASSMIKEVSNKLNIQFIIVTHNDVLASYADKTFKVIKNTKTGVSKVYEYAE